VASDPDAKLSDVDEFDEIVIVAALPSASLDANLNQLLLLVCALPIGAWLVAAAAGHWFCRRALSPVVQMSEQARSMVDSHHGARLPLLNTNDELEELARAFNTLLDHQQRAYEQQRRFTGDAAHELRTPLTVLLGQIDVALRRKRSPEEYAETLRVLRDETSQLQTIVESLLFLARSEGDATLPDTELISLADWLPEFLGHWDEHPRRDDIHLEIAADRSGVVRVSPVLLMRLFENLVENALKYSSPGTRVDIEYRDDGGEILVDVRDRGRGIAPEDVSEVFRPFFRTRDAREAGIVGTGLGLAIAARIAAACGGSLNCTSEPGKGSLFTVRLPKVTSVAAAVASEV
jgi:signal transduction histidine kinase